MLPEHRNSLDYLYSLRFFGIKLGLDNVRRLLDRLGNPQAGMRIVHVAGTNGKGSTAAAVAAIFHAAGIPAGLYTSPHLHQFTERIRIDTRQLELREAIELIEELRPFAEELQATFFEVTTALALLSFRRHGLEWAILECGMGGRLDATNIVTPEVSLITPIALDHTRHLGTTLTQVATEKAGIIKPGVAVISARQQPEVASVLQQHVERLGCEMLLPDRDYYWSADEQGVRIDAGDLHLSALRPGLAGSHQHQNLALAAATAGLLMQCGLKITNDQVRRALERVTWPGRLEWLPDRILLDGAHNQAGAQVLAAYLKQQNFSEVHLVFGCKADKQVVDMLKELLPLCHALYATCPPVDEAAEPEVLVAQAQAAGVTAAICSSPVAALQSAQAQRSLQGVIVVAGSLFLVAAIREMLVLQTDNTPILC